MESLYLQQALALPGPSSECLELALPQSGNICEVSCCVFSGNPGECVAEEHGGGTALAQGTSVWLHVSQEVVSGHDTLVLSFYVWVLL